MLGAKDPEAKLLEAGLLLDTYGSLLTERQREFTRLHFEEDLSFSEIAREFGVSRQAVHDAVKHAVQTLQRLEQHLGQVRAAGEEAGGAHIGGRQLVERLSNLRRRIIEDDPPVSRDGIVRELESLISLLESGREGDYPAPEQDAQA